MQPSTPSVFVVILSWNNVRDVVECLESLKTSDYANYCVVVVDNGSTDNTVAVVRERFPQVHMIENSCNLGYAEGNNVGIRYALGNGAEYVFILNDDTTVASDAVTQLVRAGEQDQRIGMLGPTIVSYFDHSKEYLGSRIHWETGIGEYSPRTTSVISDVDYLAGCALLVKADVIRKIGLFDSDYFAYFEDADWGMRCRRAGYRVVAAPQSKIYHKGTPDVPHHVVPASMFYYTRNQWRFMRKYTGWRGWLSFLLRYTRQRWIQFYDLTSAGEEDKANAVLSGFWAGLIGRYGANSVQAPIWFRWFVFSLLNISLGLIRLVKGSKQGEAK